MPGAMMPPPQYMYGGMRGMGAFPGFMRPPRFDEADEAEEQEEDVAATRWRQGGPETAGKRKAATTQPLGRSSATTLRGSAEAGVEDELLTAAGALELLRADGSETKGEVPASSLDVILLSLT